MIKSDANVDGSGNTSETLGSDKPKSVEASTKADVNPTVDLVHKDGSETHA
ncbi:hypothetical protein A2U01_0118563, partial [Trifolium medium]|nr:hypothetical protein [Trifolium medium]